MESESRAEPDIQRKLNPVNKLVGMIKDDVIMSKAPPSEDLIKSQQLQARLDSLILLKFGGDYLDEDWHSERSSPAGRTESG